MKRRWVNEWVSNQETLDLIAPRPLGSRLYDGTDSNRSRKKMDSIFWFTWSWSIDQLLLSFFWIFQKGKGFKVSPPKLEGFWRGLEQIEIDSKGKVYVLDHRPSSFGHQREKVRGWLSISSCLQFRLSVTFNFAISQRISLIWIPSRKYQEVFFLLIPMNPWISQIPLSTRESSLYITKITFGYVSKRLPYLQHWILLLINNPQPNGFDSSKTFWSLSR